MRNVRKSAIVALACIVIAATVGGYAAAQTVFGDKLGFVARSNANRANITGTGWVRATLEGNVLTVEGEFENMSSPVTAAHIHLAPRGQHGPVVFPLQVEGTTAGTLSGTFELSEAHLAELRAMNLYVNVHSELSPGGEIRAWLMPIE